MARNETNSISMLVLILLLSFINSSFSQGPCGGRLCLEYASGIIKSSEDDTYTFIQTAEYDFGIEWSFTPTRASSETLTEVILKHNNEVLASGDDHSFNVITSNIRSTTGRYSVEFTDRKTFVLVLHNLNKEYASGLYTVTAHFKTGKEKDQLFEKLKFSFGLKVNGGYTAWSGFTKCKRCGVDQITRRRRCANPRPEFGGLDCEHLGSNVDYFPCMLRDCKTGNRQNLQKVRLQSSDEESLSTLDMLEFGSHCFITPSSNINDKNRFFLPPTSYEKGGRDILKDIYVTTQQSTEVYLHCSKFECEASQCKDAVFMTKEVQKGNINLYDIRISVDFDEKLS